MVDLRQPIDAESLLAWFVQFLVPALRPGDIVVMDNLSSNKHKAVRQAIRAAGAKLFYQSRSEPNRASVLKVENTVARRERPVHRADRKMHRGVDPTDQFT
jgi:hypothetical protein